MSVKFLIYGLIDPRTQELRYVGQSTRGLVRPKQRHARHCWSWEENLKRVGLKPEIWVIEEFDGPDSLNEAEVFWIANFRMIGCDLTNLSAGGEGAKGVKRSDEWKENLRKKTIFNLPINLGRRHSEEEKQKRAQANRKRRGPYKGRTSYCTPRYARLVEIKSQ